MNKNCIKKGNGLYKQNLYVFDSLNSTNTWMLDNASLIKHGDVVQAREQTMGHGRFGRRWHAPKNSALLISVAIDSRYILPTNIVWLSLAGAIAVQQLLLSKKIKASLKWPNDVMANNKKICGILAETRSGIDVISLGIGLNVNQLSFDLHSEIANKAVSLRMLTGKCADIDDIRDSLLAKLEEILSLLLNRNINELYRLWTANDLFVGSKIKITLCDKTLEGTYSGITKEGNLKVVFDGGGIEIVSAGDVSII